MPGDDAPRPREADVNLGKPPVVCDIPTAAVPRPQKTPGNDRRVPEQLDSGVRCFVPLEFHAARASDGHRIGLPHYGHGRHGHDNLFGPQPIERVGIAAHVGVIPHLFEPRQLGTIVRLPGRRPQWRNHKEREDKADRAMPFQTRLERVARVIQPVRREYA